MEPILRPGSLVLVDVSVRRLQESKWSNEYDRPMYFVELHDGYRWRLVSPGRHPLGDAPSPAIAMHARILEDSRRRRNCRARSR